MDFEIGNLFYVVITIVAIIVGLLGKKKKPAGQGNGETQGGTRPGFFDNLEKAFNMGQEERMLTDLKEYEEDLPAEEMVETTAATLAPEGESLMEEYERILGQRMADMTGGSLLTDVDMIAEPLEIIDLDGEEATNYFEVIKDFDAGKAVVYSAIINRIDY